MLCEFAKNSNVHLFDSTSAREKRVTGEVLLWFSRSVLSRGVQEQKRIVVEISCSSPSTKYLQMLHWIKLRVTPAENDLRHCRMLVSQRIFYYDPMPTRLYRGRVQSCSKNNSGTSLLLVQLMCKFLRLLVLCSLLTNNLLRCDSIFEGGACNSPIEKELQNVTPWFGSSKGGTCAAGLYMQLSQGNGSFHFHDQAAYKVAQNKQITLRFSRWTFGLFSLGHLVW